MVPPHPTVSAGAPTAPQADGVTARSGSGETGVLAVKCKVMRRGCREMAQSHPSPHPGRVGPGPLALTEATSLLLALSSLPREPQSCYPPKSHPQAHAGPAPSPGPAPAPGGASLLAPTWVREQRGQSGSTRKAGPGSQPRLSPARTPGRGRGIPREELQGLRGHRQAAGCTLHGRQGGGRVLGQRRGHVRGAAQQCGAQDGAQDVHTSTRPGHQSRARPALPFPALPVARPLDAPEPARPLGRAYPPAPGSPAGPIAWSSRGGQPRRGRLGAEGASESCSTCGAFLRLPPPRSAPGQAQRVTEEGRGARTHRWCKSFVRAKEAPGPDAALWTRGHRAGATTGPAGGGGGGGGAGASHKPATREAGGAEGEQVLFFP